MTIALTTPTGHVGSRVVQLLVQAGVRPTVLVRDPGRLDPAIREHVDAVAGDLGDAAYVTEATKAAEALLWVVPESFTATDPIAEMARLGEHAAAAVGANGIRRVVLISSVGAERRHGAGLIDGLARNEETLAATAADLLVLRCGYYFTNLLADLDALRGGTLSTTDRPDRPMPWVDPRDVGEVAAAALLSDGWRDGEIRAVHGPVDLTWAEVAVTLSEAIGREVRLATIADDDLRAGLRAAGLPDGVVEGLVGMTAGLRDDFTPEQPRTPLTTTPTTLAAWAYAHLRDI